MKSMACGIARLALAIVCLVAASKVHAAPPEFGAAVEADGPIAHWRFNELSGTTACEGTGRVAVDVTGHGHNGCYLTDPSMFVFSQGVTFGDSGVRFFSNQARMQVPDDTALNHELSPTRITIEVLLIWHGGNGRDQQNVLKKFATGSNSQPVYGLSILNDGRVQFDLKTTSATSVITDATSSGKLVKRQPTHVAATYDGINARIYFNGALKKSLAVSGDLEPSTNPIIVGNPIFVNPLNPDQPVNATLDEVALYGSAIESKLGLHTDQTVASIPITINAPSPDWVPPESAPPSFQFTTATFPVQLGVPIPEGTLYDAAQARVVGPGSPVYQTKVLGRWRKFLGLSASEPPETHIPIKWLQVDFNANVMSGATYYLEYGPGVTNPSSNTMVTTTPPGVLLNPTSVVVNTGAVKFQVNRASPNLLEQVWIDLDGNSVISDTESILSTNPAAARGLYFVDQNGAPWRAAWDPNATLEVEEGPHQVTLKATGYYRSAPGQQNNGDNQWIVRIKAYRDKPFVRVYHTIVFNKASADRKYQDIGVELQLAATSPVVSYAPGYNRPEALVPDQPEVIAYAPEIAPEDATKSWMLHQARHNRYDLYKMGEQDGGAEQKYSFWHKRAGHWFDVSGTNAARPFGVTAALKGMWQNYPTALEWQEKSGEQALRVHLWTRRATGAGDAERLLDFTPAAYLRSRGLNPIHEVANHVGAQGNFEAEIQTGNPRICDVRPYETYEFSGPPPGLGCPDGCIDATGVGVAKTHEMTFEFHKERLTTAPGLRTPPETAFFLQKPVIGVVDSQWLHDSLALGRLQPKNGQFPDIDGPVTEPTEPVCTTDLDCKITPSNQALIQRKCKINGHCQSVFDAFMERYLLEQAVDGAAYPQNVPPDVEDGNKTWGDSYGAFDFGDVLTAGKGAHRYWQHNKYYTSSNFWLWYARTGDRRAYEFAENNSRHVMDIDTVHTTYTFDYSACNRPNDPYYAGFKRMYSGTPRTGDVGPIHWSSSRVSDFSCKIRPDGQACDTVSVNANLTHVPIFSQPAEFANYLTNYYYLTGYERARDVALEIASYINTVSADDTTEYWKDAYWKQAESRALGGGLHAVSELYGLFGGALPETTNLQRAASKVALKMVGRDGSGTELADNRVCPIPEGLPGLAFGQGRPVDGTSTYMFAGAAAYMRVATETSTPTRGQVSQWVRDQARAFGASNFRAWPSAERNHWEGMAVAFYEATDPAEKANALTVGMDDIEDVKRSFWNEQLRGDNRGFALHALPYLMDAIATANTTLPVAPSPEPTSSGAELQFYKSTAADVSIGLRVAVSPIPNGALLYRDTGVFGQVPFDASLLGEPVPPSTFCSSGEDSLGVPYSCKAAIVIYDKVGNPVGEPRVYPPGRPENQPPNCPANSQSSSRVWYNEGGWVETMTLSGPAGIYRARVEVDGIVTAKLTGNPVTLVSDYNRPLYHLFAIKLDPNVKVMAFGGNNDGTSPGFRYPTQHRRWFYMPAAINPAPVQFTFDFKYESSAAADALLHFPFQLFNSTGTLAQFTGGGDNVPYVITVPAGERSKRWAVDLGPEARPIQFGYDRVKACQTSPTPDECKVVAKWFEEIRPFTTTGVIPFYADSEQNYFPASEFPVPLLKPQAVSPFHDDNPLPAPSSISWRAVAGAHRYKLFWRDGATCDALNSELVTAEQAHCTYGTGKCWVQHAIARGKGRWYVQARSDDTTSASWPWSDTVDFSIGPPFLAPTNLSMTPPAPGQDRIFTWRGVAASDGGFPTHYEVQIVDPQNPNNPLDRVSVTAASNCTMVSPPPPETPQPLVPECSVHYGTPVSGSATFWIHANCSDSFAQFH